jgi:hypothetical protein
MSERYQENQTVVNKGKDVVSRARTAAFSAKRIYEKKNGKIFYKMTLMVLIFLSIFHGGCFFLLQTFATSFRFRRRQHSLIVSANGRLAL